MTASSAPVVILFAVLEGARAPAPAEEQEQRVFRLKEHVFAHDGDVVKSLSDGVMAVFRSPANAVAAGLAMRRAVAGEGSLLRVGLSLGEPLVEGEDYFGTPVVVARRLCDRAGGGQILCVSLIGRFESTRARAKFKSIGPLELKGIATPVLTCEVLDSDA